MSKNAAIPVKFLWHPVHFLGLGLGSGMPRFMPGTWGTVAALILFLIFHALVPDASWITYLLIIGVTTVIGIYLCGKTAEDLGVHDHSGIVWDEFVGFWLTMFLVPVTWYWLLAAFALFRFFDIVKPWPIRWADRQVSGGFGIMLDDLIAAAYAWGCLQIAMLLVQ